MNKIFREEATSVLVVGPLSWSNWNLEVLVFQEQGKPEYLEKNQQSKVRTNDKFNPHSTPGRISNLAGHIGGRRELSPLCLQPCSLLGALMTQAITLLSLHTIIKHIGKQVATVHSRQWYAVRSGKTGSWHKMEVTTVAQFGLLPKKMPVN